jgi:hypothetical protein
MEASTVEGERRDGSGSPDPRPDAAGRLVWSARVAPAGARGDPRDLPAPPRRQLRGACGPALEAAEVPEGGGMGVDRVSAIA